MRAETDLGRVIQLVLKGWKLVVTLTVLFALCAFLYTQFLVTPTYTSGGSLVVYNRSIDAQNAIGGYNATDMTASVRLVNTCIEIMRRPQFLDRVRAQLSESDAEALSLGKIAMSAVAETELLNIQVTDTNPYRAQRMVDAILEVAPVEIKEHIVVGSVEPVYTATPGVLRSNQMPVKVMGGALLGFVLAVLLILLADLLNTTVNSSEEISEQYGLPVLGNVPDVGRPKKHGKKEAAYQ